MGMTIAEKILARASGSKSVSPGDRIKVKADLVVFYNTSSTKEFFTAVKETGIPKLVAPERNFFSIDHYVPVKDVEYAETIQMVRDLYRGWGVPIHERLGITHHLVIEKGFVKPGMFVAHHGDFSQGGAFGALGTKVSSNLLRYMVDGEAWIDVPETIKIVVTGKFPKGTYSRDLWFKILGRNGPDSAPGIEGKVTEFSGPAIDSMSIDDRMTICGCQRSSYSFSGIMNPDEKALEWLKGRTNGPLEPLYSDPDARYEDVWEYDVSDLEPYVVMPGKAFDTRPISEVAGSSVINRAYIGSCDSGRLDDLRIAARIMKGRKKHPDVRFQVVPSTLKIMAQAAREGLVETFAESNAYIDAPTCDYCFGVIDPMAAGEVCVATAPINPQGRMGSPKSFVYLASPATAAASAVEGKLADPRKYL